MQTSSVALVTDLTLARAFCSSSSRLVASVSVKFFSRSSSFFSILCSKVKNFACQPSVKVATHPKLKRRTK